MDTIFFVTILILFIIIFVTQLVVLRRGTGSYIEDVKSRLKNYEDQMERFFRFVKDDFSRNREELNKNSKDLKDELFKFLNGFTTHFEIKSKNHEDKLYSSINNFNENQRTLFNDLFKRVDNLSNRISDTLERLRLVVEEKLKAIQDDNNTKLEKMRETVDEKLSKTLETRLGDSFKLVSERLELVHKGLGEMQTLASGVGDLKKVLTNVKTKGVLGEYQLQNILEQILTKEQYVKNAKTKSDSNNIVEFAIKLPGREESEKTVLLPIDAKFPTEDYQQLVDAYDQGNASLIEEIKNRLAKRIEYFAKDIRDKYISPPDTTDFAIMFLPFEGLYAEVLRIPALFEKIQRENKVVITGPTTISALLNSLQMGFRTLAIEKRTSEVWELLGAIKNEFSTFGTILEKTKKKMNEATNVIEQAGKKSRAIERKLRNVQQLPDNGDNTKKILFE